MSYDTVQANGQTIYTSNEGGTYENKLIDLTTGNDFYIIADGNNDTIRNIGFEGTYRGGDFMIAITGSGTIDIENIYLGDGASQEGEDFVHGPGGVFYHNDATADVNFRRCCVRGYSNNGFYCSNSASGGDILWENCYTVNCGVTHYRGASPGDEIRNCVAYNTNNERHGESSGTERFGRPVWAWAPGPIDIYDSHFSAPPRPGDGCLMAQSDSQINMHSGAFEGITDGPVNVDSSVGSTPDLSVPDGVPLDAETAADGGGGGGGGDGGDTGDDGDYVDSEGYIERFDDANALDAYTPNSGTLDDWSLSDSNAHIDAYALAGNDAHASLFRRGAITERGQEYTVSIYPPADDVGIFMFFVAVQDDGVDNSRRYGVAVNHDTGTVGIGEFGEGGANEFFDESSFNRTGTGQQWNDLVIEFGSEANDEIGYRYYAGSDTGETQ